MRAAAALVDTRDQYEHVFGIYVPVAIGVFALVVVAIVFAVLRYRNRAPASAARWHEHNRLEGAYALLLAAVVAVLLYVSLSAEHQVDTVSAHTRPRLDVGVVGSKWEWAFHYPAFGLTTRSGVVGRQPLVVPVNQPVRFSLTSADVIHALWIPQLRYKRDLIPGAVQRVTLDFDRTGTFSGQCAEFCGLRHADMVFTVRVVTGAQFRAWVARGGRAA